MFQSRSHCGVDATSPLLALVLDVSSACCSTAAADMNRDVARSEESRKKALVFAYPDHKDDCRTGEEDERFPDVDRSKTKTHG